MKVKGVEQEVTELTEGGDKATWEVVNYRLVLLGWVVKSVFGGSVKKVKARTYVFRFVGDQLFASIWPVYP